MHGCLEVLHNPSDIAHDIFLHHQHQAATGSMSLLVYEVCDKLAFTRCLTKMSPQSRVSEAEHLKQPASVSDFHDVKMGPKVGCKSGCFSWMTPSRSKLCNDFDGLDLLAQDPQNHHQLRLVESRVLQHQMKIQRFQIKLVGGHDHVVIT